MSATMGTTSGIDLAARRETAERLWRAHTGGTLRSWLNTGGYTLRGAAYERDGTLAGELTIRANEIRYRPNSGTFTTGEQAAVRAIRAALIGETP